MTHAQKFWTAEQALKEHPSVTKKDIQTIRTWMKQPQSHIPQDIRDEQIILFLHSNYSDIENTQKCMEEYYRLKSRAPQFFEKRDVQTPAIQKALQILHYAILPEKTPENYKIVFHRLNNTDPTNYVFNDGFKLLTMMIDAVYMQEGPVDGLLLLFDMRGVKLGHITKLPLVSVRRSLEYIQDAIPVRLKGIHVLNVHPIIDKIMMLIRPFLRKNFLSLIHFHKEGDEEVYKTFPKYCLPQEYGGELENVQYYHDNFCKNMKALRSLFTEEEDHLFRSNHQLKSSVIEDINLSKLDID